MAVAGSFMLELSEAKEISVHSGSTDLQSMGGGLGDTVDNVFLLVTQRRSKGRPAYDYDIRGVLG